MGKPWGWINFNGKFNELTKHKVTSSLKGFKISANDSMEVVDKLTALDLKAATSAGEIANGLSQFANLGSTMGVDIDEAAAYVATISDVTQMSGDSAGQALKTIISRYGNVKATAYGNVITNSDTDEGNNAVNDVEKVLKNLGISIRSSALEFKDFDDVLNEIAEKWSSLDSVSKRAVGTAFAGTRQQEAFTTLMENWDKYRELYDVSKNSKGTAEEKYQSYEESFQAAANELKAEWEKVLNESELITVGTKLVNVITGALKVLGPIVEKFWPTLLSWILKDTVPDAIQNIKMRGMRQDAYNKGVSYQKLYGDKAEKEDAKFEQPAKHLSEADSALIKFSEYLNNIADGKTAIGKPTSTENKTTTPTENTTQTQNTQNSEIPISGMIGSDMMFVNQGYTTGGSNSNIDNGKNNNGIATLPTNPSLNVEPIKTSDIIASGSDMMFVNQGNLNLENKLEEVKESVDENAEKTEEVKEEVSKDVEATKETTEAVREDTAKSNGSNGNSSTSSSSSNNTTVINKDKNKNNKNSAREIAGAVLNTVGSFNSGVETHWANGAFGKATTVSSSDEAQSSGRKTKGTLTAIGTVLGALTPLGPMIGSTIGSVVGEAIGDAIAVAIDYERDQANKETEEANTRLSTIKDIESTTEDLTEYISDIDIEDNLTSINDYVREIKESLLENDEYEKYNEIIQSGSYTNSNGEEYNDIYEVLKDLSSSDYQTRQRAQDILNAVSYAEEADETEKSYTAENYTSNKELQDTINDMNSGDAFWADTLNDLLEDIINWWETTGVEMAEGIKEILLWITPGLNIVRFAKEVTKNIVTASKEDLVSEVTNKFNLITDADEVDFDKMSSTQLDDYANRYKQAVDYLTEYKKNNPYGDTEAIQDVIDELTSIYTKIDSINSNLETQVKSTLIANGKSAYSTSTLKDESVTEIRNSMKNSPDGIKSLYDYMYNTYIGKEGESELKRAGIDIYDENDSGKYSSDVLAILKKIIADDDEITTALTSENLTLAEAYDLHTDGNGNAKSSYDKDILENFANAIGVDESVLGEYVDMYSMLDLTTLQKNATEVVDAAKEYTSLLDDICDGTKSMSEWMNKIVTNYPDLIQYMGDENTLIEKMVEKGEQYVNLELQKQKQELDESDEYFKNYANGEMQEWAESTGNIDLYNKAVVKSGAENISDINELINSIYDNYEKLNVLQDSKGQSYTPEEVQELAEMLTSFDTTLTSDLFKDEEENYIDYRTKLMDAEINNLTKQKDALKEITNQREYENKLIEAKLKLENAMNDKKRVYRAGVGFVYEADQSAIKEAKDNLKEVEVDKQVSAIQKQIDILQGEKDEWSNIWTKKTYEANEKRAQAFEENYLDGSSLSVYRNLTEEEKQEAIDSGIIAGTLGDGGSAATALTAMGAFADNGKTGSYAKLTENYWDPKITQLLNAIKIYGYQEYTGDDGDGTGDSGNGNASSGDNDTSFKNTISSTGVRAAIDNLTPNKKLAFYQTIADIAEGKGTYYNGDFTTSMYKWLNTELDGISYSDVSQLSAADLSSLVSEANSVIDSYTNGSLNSSIDTLKNATTVIKKYMPDDPSDYYEEFIKSWGISGLLSMYQDISNANGYNEMKSVLHKYYGDVAFKDNFNIGNLKKEASTFISDYNNGVYTPLENYLGRQYLQKYFANGTLSTYGDGLSMINELGTEAIVTPNGTITSLPSHSGILPADLTKNLWSLGEIAPNILRAVDNYSNGISGTSNNNQSITDESFNISNLTMNVDASGDFDLDAFVTSIKNRVALSKNSH